MKDGRTMANMLTIAGLAVLLTLPVAAFAQGRSQSDWFQSDRYSGQSGQDQYRGDWEREESDRGRQFQGSGRSGNQWSLEPTGWVSVAYDYDRDGRIDAVGELYAFDLERAKDSSRQRMEREGRSSDQQGRTQRWDQEELREWRDEWTRDQDDRQRQQRQSEPTRSGRDRDWQASRDSDRERQQWQSEQMRSGQERDWQPMRDSNRERQQWQRDRDDERQQWQSDRYQQEQLGAQDYGRDQRRVSGTVSDTTTVRLAGLREGEHLIAKVRTPQGTVPVDLGPKDRVSERLDLRQGDEISVTGTNGTINGRSVLIANRITSDGREVTIQRERGELKQVRGEIASTRTASFQGHDQDFMLAELRTSGGETTTINLGPKSKLQKLDLSQGDQISALVRLGKVNGRPALIAERVRSGDQTVSLSDLDEKTFQSERSAQDASSTSGSGVTPAREEPSQQ